MGMAPVAHVVFNKFMTFNPKNPDWVNRDRFVLSYVFLAILLRFSSEVCAPIGLRHAGSDLRRFEPVFLLDIWEMRSLVFYLRRYANSIPVAPNSASAVLRCLIGRGWCFQISEKLAANSLLTATVTDACSSML
jgi:hypothetical protein